MGGVFVKITQEERKELLRRIRKASGVAQYALKAKMTDQQLLEADEHLEVLGLIREANNYNRRHLGMNTQKVNEELTDIKQELTVTQKRLQAFLNPDNSEIVRAGRWLMDALALRGSDRKRTLLVKELVHKQDYNETVADMRDTIATIYGTSEEMAVEAEVTISELEKRIDTLKYQMSQVQTYISMNEGADKWRVIRDTFKIQ